MRNWFRRCWGTTGTKMEQGQYDHGFCRWWAQNEESGLKTLEAQGRDPAG